MAHIPVFQGRGGYADDYPEIASSLAGREYDREGMHILDQHTLQEMASQARSSKDLQAELRRILSTNQSVEIFVLAPPTDLSALLEASPELANHISRVHLMGGWVEVERPGGTELRSVAETFVAGNSWDNHLMDRIPELETVIGRASAGMRFSPVDPAVIVGAFAPGFINSRTSVRVQLDKSDLDPKSGYQFYVEPSADSQIEMVEGFDENVFREVFTEAFKAL